MLTPLLLALAAPAQSLPEYQETVNGAKLVVLCDPKRFRFSVRAYAGRDTLDRSYPRRTVIDPNDLMAPLPGHTGRTQVLGPLVRYERCGPYTVQLEGAAYNTNVEGEAGAYEPFVAVSVIAGSFTIYPGTGDSIRFTDCDRSLPLARGCPDGYAVRLDGDYDARRRKLVMVETVASHDDLKDGAARVTQRRIERDDDWTNWQGEGD